MFDMFNLEKKKEDKREQQIQKILEKYGFEALSEHDIKTINKINADLSGLGLMKSGMSLSFTKAEEQAKVGYLSALVEQNWIIIRMLNEINNKLDK